MESFFLNLGLIETALAACLAVTFVVQLVYYLGFYGRIPTYRQKVSAKENPPVSVVVTINDNLYYVQEVLPLLLAQDYPEYEVVVVDNGSGIDVSESLKAYAAHDPRIKYTRINPDPKFRSRRKFVLTVGIKACSYPDILFTETNCRPVSKNWLGMMAKGFTTGQVVIGYTGIEPGKGLANRIIRCSRLMTSVRYLSAAIRGRTYRGISSNLGFTSELYFKNKGYNYLNMNIGDEDLFVRKIATPSNVSVVLHPKATIRESHYGGLSMWYSERKFFSYAFRYYPAGVKASVSIELLSRFLFFGAAIAILVLRLPVLWIAAVGMLALRWLAVFFTVSRICLRVGEKGLMPAFFIHDFFSPISETFLSLARRIRPSRGIWV